MAMFQSDDTEGMRKMATAMGPSMVDQSVRQAIQFCWMMMPPDRQNPQSVAAEVRRIVERALRDMAEDAEAFRSGPGSGPSLPPPSGDGGR